MMVNAIVSQAPSRVALAGLKFRWYTWLFALAALIGSLVFMPHGSVDWTGAFEPASLRWWDAPWERNMPQPPWGAVLLWPLALLGSYLATALVNGASVLLLARLVHRWDGPEWTIFPVLLSPVGWALFYYGQIDVLLLAGLFLPKGVGALVYLLKPQMTLGVLFAHRRQLIGRALIPGVVVGLLSFVVWGPWPLSVLHRADYFVHAGWNITLWPYLAPVGLWCIWRAWKTEDERYGIVASPLMSIYVNLSSYIGLLIVLAARWPREAVFIWLFVSIAMVLIVW